jgi:hypothetical protein
VGGLLALALAGFITILTETLPACCRRSAQRLTSRSRFAAVPPG